MPVILETFMLVLNHFISSEVLELLLN